MASRAKNPPTNHGRSLSLGIGIGLLVFGGYILARLFHDPLKQEVRYAVSSAKSAPSLQPPSTQFALVIDKLGASSVIVEGVDPYNGREYQRALKDGVAHAKGTGLPGQGGNIFLFAHSSADLLTAERYNSVFYLMHHLVPGDPIKVWYQDQEYTYAVSDKRLVSPTDLSYLTSTAPTETLTLMTCWPPGTTLKRLIIIAKAL